MITVGLLIIAVALVVVAVVKTRGGGTSPTRLAAFLPHLTPAITRLATASWMPFVIAGIVALGLFIGFWPEATWPVVKTGWWWLMLATLAFIAYGYINVPTEDEVREGRRNLSQYFRRAGLVLVIIGLAIGAWVTYGGQNDPRKIPETVGTWFGGFWSSVQTPSASPRQQEVARQRPLPSPLFQKPLPYKQVAVEAPTDRWSEPVRLGGPRKEWFYLQANTSDRDVPIRVLVDDRKTVEVTLNKVGTPGLGVGQVHRRIQFQSRSGKPVEVVVERYHEKPE